MVDVVVLLLAIVAILVTYVGAIISAARRPYHAFQSIGRSKPGTIFMIVITGFIGGIYFLLRLRPGLIAAERATPAESLPPPDTGDVKEWRRTKDPWS